YTTVPVFFLTTLTPAFSVTTSLVAWPPSADSIHPAGTPPMSKAILPAVYPRFVAWPARSSGLNRLRATPLPTAPRMVFARNSRLVGLFMEKFLLLRFALIGKAPRVLVAIWGKEYIHYMICEQLFWKGLELDVALGKASRW